MTNSALLTVKYILQFKAEWCRKIAAVYPDPRNLIAAELLEQMAIEAETSDHLADKLVDVKAVELNQAASETAHKVGYWSHPHDLSDFLNLVCEKAAKIREEHDAVFPSKKGNA